MREVGPGRGWGPAGATLGWSRLPLAARKVLVIPALALSLLLSPPAQAAVCLLPLGDSITQAPASNLSYRYWLWEDLVDAGYDVDFVGSLTTGYGGGSARYPDFAFDRDHEGHAGWRADQVLNRLGFWMFSTPYDVDVAMVHLGTNDVFQGNGNGSTVLEIRGIINQLRADNPGVTVLLAQIIPTTTASANKTIGDLNDRLAVLAATMDSDASPVVLVDMETGFDARWMTTDGVHPNSLGEQFMAERWADALVDAWDGATESCE